MVFSARSRALLLATLALAMVVALPMGQAAPGGTKSPAKTDEPSDEGDEGATTEETPAEPAGDANDAVLTPAVEELLSLRPCRVVNGVANLAYSLSDPAEANDFESNGFDKVELHQVVGNRMSDVGLELGAGSSQVGRLRHKLPLGGTFTIEVELWAAHAAPSSIVCFGLSEKVGVLWGQQLVKPSSLKPWAKSQAAADPTLFGAERPVKAKITATNGMEVTVECNGRRVAAHRFTKGELKNARFALFARNCRLVVTDLQIKGQVDGAKL